eukprot:1148898-Pelagomonas_calceolata.AAC.1
MHQARWGLQTQACGPHTQAHKHAGCAYNHAGPGKCPCIKQGANCALVHAHTWVGGGGRGTGCCCFLLPT